MGLVMKCPYYVSEKRNTISCENNIRHFAERDKKREYMLRFCCSCWEECTYAESCKKMYKSIEKLPRIEQDALKSRFFMTANKKTVKKLLQQIGMMEKTAESNAEMYKRERERFNQVRLSDARSIFQLENCIGYLVNKFGDGKVDLDDYKKFFEKYEVSYKVSDDAKFVEYSLTEKGGSTDAGGESGGSSSEDSRSGKEEISEGPEKTNKK